MPVAMRTRQRIEERHVEAGRDAEDDADGGGVEADGVGPQRQHDLPGRPEHPDRHGAHPGGEERRAVVAHDGGDPDRRMARGRRGLVRLGHHQEHDVADDGQGDVHVVGAVEPDGPERHRTEEGPDEGADPLHAAEGRQRPAAEVGRHDVADVGEPRQQPDRPPAPHEEHEEGEQRRRGAGHAPDERPHEDDGGDEHGPALAVAGDERAGGDVEDHGPDPPEGHGDAGQRHRRADVPGGEGDDRHHRALAHGEDERRQVHRRDQRAHRRDRDVVGGGGRGHGSDATEPT
jgi:hypothetical protein